MNLAEQVKTAVRDVPDFPKPGVVFKDITPLLKNPFLCRQVIEYFAYLYEEAQIEAIVGVESRGFLLGMPLALRMGVPFVPVRKKGKLPYECISHTYDLEYGQAETEIHTDAITPGTRVLIHDDVLATGGTAAAAAELVKKLDGTVVGYSFLIELGFLNGRPKLEPYTQNVQAIVSY